MTIKELNKITGGLSKTKKMPCHSYSLSFHKCKAGSRLGKIKGTVCYSCYSKKGNYGYPSVKKALDRRFLSIKNKNWSIAMAELITLAGSKYFRWHDSGDIQNNTHLNKIVRVCELTPNVTHYLPTKEYALVQKYFTKHTLPKNLVIRFSSPIINTIMRTEYLNNVVMTETLPKTKPCPATKKTSKTHTCGTCRNCWDKDIKTIGYYKH